MNKTIKRNVVLSAVLAIMLCVSLITGATFALFTSESKVNVAVTSGKVKVTATASDPVLGTTLEENLDETTATRDGNTITLDKIVPGDYVTFNITIHNESNVTAQYRTVIELVEDDGLWAGLEVTFDEVEYEGTTAVKTEWATMAVSTEDTVVAVKVSLPEEAGNEYQEKSCKFSYTVEAVQGNADMPSEWNGVTVTNPTLKEDGKYHIATAAEFYSFVSGDFAIAAGNTVVLDSSIDLGGAIVKGYCNSVFDSNFDGQGHTVSNFTVITTYFDGEHYCGLFPYVNAGCYVKNLTVKDAAAIAPFGVGQVGMIAGAAYNGSVIENCHAINCTIAGEKKVGSVVGYTTGTVAGCSATDCEIYCGVAQQAGAVVGFIDQGTVTGETSENVNITYEAYYGAATDATALATALKATKETINIVLADDITMDITTLGTQTPGSGQYKLGDAATTAINIDLGGHKLTLNTTYWSALGAKNNAAVITVKNGSMNSVGNNANTWNGYDLTFYDCKWIFENVTFDKAVAIATGANVEMKDVIINESNSAAAAYALWITADGQTVTLDNVTIKSNGGRDTRAIAIKDEYRVATAQRVTLNIKNSKIESAKKAAILVTSNAGATINASNVDIAGVAADSTNLVWVDNGANYGDLTVVTVTGGTAIVEP